MVLATETVHKRSEAFSLKAGRQSLSPLLPEQKEDPEVFLLLFGSAQNLVKKKKKDSRACPHPWGGR